MANKGKFIDRSPIIYAAGKSTGLTEENVASSLREYSLEDQITAIKHDANIWKEDVFVPPRNLPPIKNASFCGTNTEVKKILNPPMLTRYQELIQNLKDTPYESFWNKELGKPRDYIPGLPVGMIPELVTFGSPPVKETPMKDLVSPPKSPYEVLWDSQVAHEWYKKTHNDYNPSEKITRGYNDHFNPNQRFGGKSRYDPRGIWVRCACEWHNNEPLAYANQIQANFMERTKPQLGKTLAPNHNIECLPTGHRFGRVTPSPFYGVFELLKDAKVSPCMFKRDFYKWLGSLNRLKLIMKNRTNEDFHFGDFYKKALYFDKEKTGWLPIDTFYELCACHKLMFPKEDIESLMKVLCVIADNKIDYKRFIDIININKPPFQIMEFNDVPKESRYYLTTNQAASCDYLIMDNSDMRTAGVPSIRYDLETPITPFGGCRADIEHLGDYTSVNALINPSVYTNYGLTYRDFFVPRSPETIRTLFEKVGYCFPGDAFEKLWKIGMEMDKTALVCVDTFKTLLKTYCPPSKLAVDEQECERKN